MIKKTLLVLLLCAGSGQVLAQQATRRLVTLHPTIGGVVTPEVNLRYNLFGDLPGLLCAKFYVEADGDYQLRIITASQMYIKWLSNEAGKDVLKRIEKRMATATSAAELPPAYPVTMPSGAQGQLMKFVLDDETVLNGTILRTSPDSVTITTPAGIAISLPENKIRELRQSQMQLQGGNFYRTDPNSTRLLFAPTARGLRQGQGYFADYYIFFPTLAVGLTEFFAVGGGMSIIPGASSQLLYVAPKISFSPSRSIAIAGGFLHLGIPNQDDVTITYGVATLGSSQAAITAGFGLPVTNSDDDAIFLFGGEIQTSNSSKIISENWIPTSGDAALSLGVRFFGEHLAVDLAFITAKSLIEDIEGWPFIPWVDFAVNFGN
jgi:hypothetical protein